MTKMSVDKPLGMWYSKSVRDDRPNERSEEMDKEDLAMLLQEAYNTFKDIDDSGPPGEEYQSVELQNLLERMRVATETTPTY